ncbi:MAG: VOC family protein [Actinocatenispora sp.]
MDALHPRLLVEHFPRSFRFYDAVLPDLFGATRTRGDARGPYASWDLGDEGMLTLFDRAVLAAALGTAGQSDDSPAGDRAMLVSRVADVDAGYAMCVAHGATPVTPPTARPDWGPTMRTAHLRDPDGNLWELQSY